MALTLDKIELAISSMDQTYDANFGEWIRNEDNCKIVAYHLKRYISQYPSHDFVVVLKWIVKDWTLRSIIILSKMMIISNLESNFDMKIVILQGLIHTWHTAFIAEFLISTSKILNEDLKKEGVFRLLENFEKGKVESIISEMGDKMDNGVKENVLIEHNTNRIKTKTKKKNLLDAFNIL